MDCTTRSKGQLQPLTTITQVIIGVFAGHRKKRPITSLESGSVFYRQHVGPRLNRFNCTTPKVEINPLGETHVPQINGRTPDILQLNKLKIISIRRY